MSQDMPKTPVEAVTLGLFLALTAPTESKAMECARMAGEIAAESRLSKEDVEQAKKLAEVMSDSMTHKFSVN